MTLAFGKDKTLVIKGVAIIFMMFLHCYASKWYIKDIDFSHAPLSKINEVFKICVGIFVFMVGYGFNFSKTKDWRYSLIHIKKLLIPFWTILFIFTIPLCFNSFICSGWMTMIFNLIGIDSQFNYFSWFVYFFIYAMIIMPFISRFINKRPLVNTIITIIVSYLLEVAIHSIPGVLENRPLLALFNCLLHTPCMILGYFFAHEKIYEKIEIQSKTKSVILGVILIIFPLVPRNYCTTLFGFQLDFFYAPIVICGILLISNIFKKGLIYKLLVCLGEASVYMWFFHALFFTKAVSWFYQPAIAFFNDINLVVLWTIVFTFVVSCCLSKITEMLTILFSRNRNIESN